MSGTRGEERRRRDRDQKCPLAGLVCFAIGFVAGALSCLVALFGVTAFIRVAQHPN